MLLVFYRERGCLPRVHASSGKSFANHLNFNDRMRIQNFIANYAETHAVFLPGRIPGFKRDDLQLLPSSETKANVWRRYKLATEESGYRVVAISTFWKVLNAVCPFIICHRPMTDVCWQCQKNNCLLYRSANLPDNEKAARCQLQQAHLEQVNRE
ncbi:uncharacterized protein LOC119728211 [Patiria miniata]|uniref:Uncharacterized protein n=1 Tax=Patiria miniata TaxID=46514 RepID=A0A913ZY90_PATMI|nr:uncharacterized protein LOC119728211 [Patiria miniata]